MEPMDEIWKVAAWVSGAAGALVLGVASSYLRDGIDRWWRARSLRRQEAKTVYNKRLRAYVEHLVADQDALDEARQEELRIRTGLPISVGFALFLASLTVASLALAPFRSPAVSPLTDGIRVFAGLYSLVLLLNGARQYHKANLTRSTIALVLSWRRGARKRQEAAAEGPSTT
jgi:hypothetical protein